MSRYAVITIPSPRDDVTAIGINTHFFNEANDANAVARARQLAQDNRQELASVSKVVYKNRELNGNIKGRG
ncbi:MAG: hypothetical protein GTN99_02945 [Candidatus Dadabacteria bacterium]|nr:hypothetical protein [Candidatus Dadabacteria bacterium]